MEELSAYIECVDHVLGNFNFIKAAIKYNLKLMGNLRLNILKLDFTG